MISIARFLGLVLALQAFGLVASAQERIPVVRTERTAPRLQVVGEFLTRALPKSVAISPNGRLWVCNFGRIDGENVFVYDEESFQHIGTVEFDGNAVETAFSPDGAFAYVSNFRRGRVEIVDTETFEVVREVVVGANPKTLVATPDGTRLYVALYSQRQVAVVDTASWEVVQRLHTGRQPRGMVFTEGRLYVASFRSDFVQAFDAEGVEQHRFETCPYPRDLEPGAGEDLVVTCTLGSIRRYSLTGTLLEVAQTGRNPRSLAVSDNGRWAVSANFAEGDVTLVDLQSHAHRTSEVPDAAKLVGIAILPHGDSGFRVFATSWLNRRVYVLEPR